MSRTVSPSANRVYGVRRVCEELELARSTFYACRDRRERSERVLLKRGPKTKLSDEHLTEKIREILQASPFVGEGHRKVWARLRATDVRTSRPRILRLMRIAGLLAPHRAKRTLGPRSHEGTIITEQPDMMWGTDFTTTMTVREGQAAVFIAVDHCTSEGIGIHAAKSATRFEALEPIRQGVREHLGGFEANIATGLSVRHDNGTQYISRHFQKELDFLGIVSSPSFVRSPEGNGCAERFIKTLKEQLLWVRTFETIEELRLALHEWLKTYNEQWLVERHGYRAPSQVRRDIVAKRSAA